MSADSFTLDFSAFDRHQFGATGLFALFAVPLVSPGPMIVKVALRVLRITSLVLLLAAVRSVAADAPAPFDLEAARATLNAIESSLKRDNVDDAELQRLRGENDALGLALSAAVADMAPKLAASEKRLGELTPKSKDAAPANDAASAELEAEKKRHDELDARLRAARAMLIEVDDNSTLIGGMRRELFARRTLEQSYSLFDPRLWINAIQELPADVRVMRALIGGWVDSLRARASWIQALGLAGVALALALVAVPLQLVSSRVIYRDPSAEPNRLRRALAAAWTILVLGVLPLLGLSILAFALDTFGISEPRMRGVVDAFFDAARILVTINAVGQGMLSPRSAPWRIIGFSDYSAIVIFRSAMIIAAIWAVERLVEPAADAVASLNIAVAARALGSALVALTVGHALRRLARRLEGPPGSVDDGWAPSRALVWAAALIVFGAAALGYVALAAFLVNQALSLTILASLLYLFDVIVHDGAEALLRPDAPIGGRLFALLGLKRNTLAQVAVVIQGAARVVVAVVAAAALLRPLGLQSQDMLSILRAAYFGFPVAGVTLSLSSMVAAAAVFLVAAFATRAVQKWLDKSLMPTTSLDAGASHSITTIFGYAGLVVAVLLACAQVGLDVQKLAIVAGALSVGIGFGLQGIANNFVSGLILLWERSIRVGDWIVVGADQGTVRSIKARATEIETFDRGTLIVPNSNLVSGIVKNWVLSDRTGQIVISINVAYESDVEEVRDILLVSAKAHDVLAIPAPSVQFAAFGEWALKFNLICFVDDIGSADRTRSDMSFDILRRMREANIRVPYPQVGRLGPGAK